MDLGWAGKPGAPRSSTKVWWWAGLGCERGRAEGLGEPGWAGPGREGLVLGAGVLLLWRGHGVCGLRAPVCGGRGREGTYLVWEPLHGRVMASGIQVQRGAGRHRTCKDGVQGQLGVGTRVRVTLAPGRAAPSPETPGRRRVHQGDWQDGQGDGQ